MAKAVRDWMESHTLGLATCTVFIPSAFCKAHRNAWKLDYDHFIGKGNALVHSFLWIVPHSAWTLKTFSSWHVALRGHSTTRCGPHLRYCLHRRTTVAGGANSKQTCVSFSFTCHSTGQLLWSNLNYSPVQRNKVPGHRRELLTKTFYQWSLIVTS